MQRVREKGEEKKISNRYFLIFNYPPFVRTSSNIINYKKVISIGGTEK